MSKQHTTQEQDLVAYQLIGWATQYNPNGVSKALKDNGVNVEPYGVNPSLQENYLTKLYHQNKSRFSELLKQVPLDQSKFSPKDKQAVDNLISVLPKSNGVRKFQTGGTTGLPSWLTTTLGFIQGTPQTSGGGTQSQTTTSSGAYIAYIILGLAIVGILYYMFKTIK